MPLWNSSASINPDDVNTTLDTVDSATDNLFTGDRIDITTEDSVDWLLFLPLTGVRQRLRKLLAPLST